MYRSRHDESLGDLPSSPVWSNNQEILNQEILPLRLFPRQRFPLPREIKQLITLSEKESAYWITEYKTYRARELDQINQMIKDADKYRKISKTKIIKKIKKLDKKIHNQAIYDREQKIFIQLRKEETDVSSKREASLRLIARKQALKELNKMDRNF